MKLTWLLIVILILVGCTTVNYESKHPSGVVEKYTMRTWFKAVEDLSVMRTPEIFALSIGSTNTDDENIFQSVARILEIYSSSAGLKE